MRRCGLWWDVSPLTTFYSLASQLMRVLRRLRRSSLRRDHRSSTRSTDSDRRCGRVYVDLRLAPLHLDLICHRICTAPPRNRLHDTRGPAVYRRSRKAWYARRLEHTYLRGICMRGGARRGCIAGHLRVLKGQRTPRFQVVEAGPSAHTHSNPRGLACNGSRCNSRIAQLLR